MSVEESYIKLDALKASADHLDVQTTMTEDKELAVANTAASSLGLSGEEWTAAEKKLIQKLDLTLVPMLWILYLFNYLDRNNIAYVNLSCSASIIYQLTPSVTAKRDWVLSRRILASKVPSLTQPSPFSTSAT